MHYLGFFYLFIIALAVTTFYIYTVAKNKKLKLHQKFNWVVVLILFSTPSMIIYWFKYIREAI